MSASGAELNRHSHIIVLRADVGPSACLPPKGKSKERKSKSLINPDPDSDPDADFELEP